MESSHHNHLRDLIALSIRIHLNDDALAEARFKNPKWSDDARVKELEGFKRTRICQLCNNLDAVDYKSRAGRWFSFDLDQLTAIRAAGGMDNGSTATREAVQSIRLDAKSEYSHDIFRAVTLGRTMAQEFKERSGRLVRTSAAGDA